MPEDPLWLTRPLGVTERVVLEAMLQDRERRWTMAALVDRLEAHRLSRLLEPGADRHVLVAGALRHLDALDLVDKDPIGSEVHHHMSDTWRSRLGMLLAEAAERLLAQIGVPVPCRLAVPAVANDDQFEISAEVREPNMTSMGLRNIGESSMLAIKMEFLRLGMPVTCKLRMLDGPTGGGFGRIRILVTVLETHVPMTEGR